MPQRGWPAPVRTLPVRTRTVLLLPALLLLVAGCGDSGELVAAGPTPTASGPVNLWPGRQGAVVPPADPGGAPPEYVPGLPRVKNQDVHEVDPVALVQAELRAHPNTDVGPDGMPRETADAVLACGKEPTGKCPVLSPYYRDLTGNGKDEIVVGIELPDKMLSVRAYTADPDGRLNRIMATIDTVIGVELAGRDVILRAPSGNNGYELITAWSWDGKQRSMLPTREQIVRVPGPARPQPSTDATPGTGSATGSGPATGSATSAAAAGGASS
ncbi:lipoprotein [Streptomyces sp. WM4235]|nr:lipoprotein [Streptomyces sp. WM4235]